MRRSFLALLALPFALAACGASTPSSDAPASGTPPSSAVQPRPKSAVIDMQNDAYNPQDVAISVGGTVTFINRGSEKRQPMADPHPEHSLVAGFSAPEISEGSTYSFTFSQAGSFGYHDELNPAITGTITVEGSN